MVTAAIAKLLLAVKDVADGQTQAVTASKEASSKHQCTVLEGISVEH